MANGTRAFALSGSNLVSFDPANPAIGTSTTITGLTAGETLVGIDFRPQNGILYGLGVNSTTDTATLYAISTQTGVATAVGSGIAFAVDLPDPASTGYGFDFNPAVDRIRVTTDSGLNFRINPNTGTLAGLDSAINGPTTSVDGAAYTNNQPNNGNITTLYTLDAVTNSLFIQNPPNNGTQTSGQTVTLNGIPLDFTNVNGFDLQAGINVASNNAPASGSALAALTVGGVTSLYSINLVDAAATLVGPVLNGAIPVSGLAVQSDLGGIPAIALSADGTSLLRFSTGATGTATTVAVSGIGAGETLVGIDFRPQTGQLYALGVNATANTATLYLVDPQGGGLTTVGTPSQIAFVDAMGVPVDLPDPATTGYGFDFNPTVDRVRVTTDTGLNFRVNPNNGAPVDGNTGPAGIQPDSSINGLPAGATGISAAAYTNSFGQSLGVNGPTTLYTLESTTNMLFIQNPANGGTQTVGLAVTLNGSALDFTGVSGFDIPAGVTVTSSNAPAAGFGYAALTVAGTTGLYQINLATGVATNLGAIGSGTPLAGLALSGMPFTPAITSNGGGDTASVSVAENGTAVTTVTATDGDGNALTFAIAGGADAAAFVIDAATGALAFAAAPDFEAPTDADQNNMYDVVVQASDGMLTDSQALSVSVTDVDGVTIVGTKGKDVVDADSTVAGQPLPTGEEDVIQGRKGNDKLDGGAGDDRLEGDRGKNKLTGGLGDDAFVFDEKLGKGKDGSGNNSSYAKIVDFGVGDDGFELSQAVFKKLDLGILSDDAFRDIGEKATKETRIAYKANGELSYDKDGKGGADAVVFAKVDKGLDLSMADFLIV